MSLDCFLKSGNLEDFLIHRPFENFLKSGDLKDFLYVGVKRDNKLVYFESEDDDDVILLTSPPPVVKKGLLYFEKQENGFCLVHAFNNIVQNKKPTTPLLKAADLFNTNAFIKDTTKNEIDLTDGNFWMDCLKEFLSTKPDWKLYLLPDELINPFQLVNDKISQKKFIGAALNDKNVLGLIIGNGGHWVAGFKWNSEFLYVDSNNTRDISEFGRGPVIKSVKSHPTFNNAKSLIDACYTYIGSNGSISILSNVP